jgi:hypothetical protein
MRPARPARPVRPAKDSPARSGTPIPDRCSAPGLNSIKAGRKTRRPVKLKPAPYCHKHMRRQIRQDPGDQPGRRCGENAVQAPEGAFQPLARSQPPERPDQGGEACPPARRDRRRYGENVPSSFWHVFPAGQKRALPGPSLPGRAPPFGVLFGTYAMRIPFFTTSSYRNEPGSAASNSAVE